MRARTKSLLGWAAALGLVAAALSAITLGILLVRRDSSRLRSRITQLEASLSVAAAGTETAPVPAPAPVAVPVPVPVAVPALRLPDPPAAYPQIGYLTCDDGAPPLPLFGRPSVARKGRWYYYTVVPGGIKAPLEVRRRMCMEEVGCEELFDGDNGVIVRDHPTSGGLAWTVRLYTYDRV